jgi:hypothetical protein
MEERIDRGQENGKRMWEYNQGGERETEQGNGVLEN